VATNSRTILRWLRAPIHLGALLTGAKSFADNLFLGSARLNRIGLHGGRLRAAHALARWRRARLASLLPAEQRQEFDRNGYVIIRDLLPEERFARLRSAIFSARLEAREQLQGDTITRRVAIGAALRRGLPDLDALLGSQRWKGLMAYVASTRSEPLYYIQTVLGGVAAGPPDPQLDLHSDTFQPSLKAWYFLTDVEEDGRPFTYVAGSHRLTSARLEWERKKSLSVLREGDRLSQRGSLRVSRDELQGLGLPQPSRLCVPANTLIVADTYGFHARGEAGGPTVRVEIWAYCRRSPFLPWTGLDLLSWRPISLRRTEWLNSLLDWLDHRGWMKQHWRRVGKKSVLEPSLPVDQICPSAPTRTTADSDIASDVPLSARRHPPADTVTPPAVTAPANGMTHLNRSDNSSSTRPSELARTSEK
jgi:hypothetical protein